MSILYTYNAVNYTGKCFRSITHLNETELINKSKSLFGNMVTLTGRTVCF